MRQGKGQSGPEAGGRLTELGLTEDMLTESILYGLRFLADCTNNDPPSIKGMLVWAKGTRRLRELLVPLGWTVDNAQNYSITVHPTDMHAIAVTTGDFNTGNPEGDPATNKKGPATEAAVRRNAYQMSFADVDSSFQKPKPVFGVQTWLLLHHRNASTKKLHVELSLPYGMDVTGHVTQWLERIVIEPVEFDLGAVPSNQVPVKSTPVVVPVQSRRS